MNSKNSIPSIVVIVAAGGTGTRFGGDKLLAPLENGETVFARCLRNLQGSGVSFVVPARDASALRKTLPEELAVVVSWVPGGDTRAHSVGKALDFLAERGVLPDAIAVHDGARPYATYALLQECWALLQRDPTACGVIPFHRVTDTIHIADPASGALSQTPPRALLRAAETPQFFRTQALLESHRRWAALPLDQQGAFTDDASLVCAMLPEARILFYENPRPNPKITFPHDLHLQ